DGVRALMRRRSGQQLLLAVYQVAGVVGGQFEAVAVGNCVGGAGLHAIAAEDAAVVIDVVHLGVAFGAAYALLSGILRGLDINAVRGAGGGAQKTGHALFQPVLVTLQHMHATKAVLEHRAAGGAGAIGIVLHDGGLEHLSEGDAHAFGNGGDVLNDYHTASSV